MTTETKPILKVKSEDKAKQLIEFADINLITASYTFEAKRKWYVITFDCSPYTWLFFQRQLRKQFK